VVDFRPFVRPVIVIADAQVAEEISRPSPAFPHALGKDQGLSRFRWVLGKESIALTEVNHVFDARSRQWGLVNVFPVLG
jgi:hypothetical protein